jgi:polysaccharide export outer membrane protein
LTIADRRKIVSLLLPFLVPMTSMLRALFRGFVIAAFLPFGVFASQDRSPEKPETSRTQAAGREFALADYVIQPLDMIRVQIYQEAELTRDVRVSQEGNIEMPLIRIVDLKNKSVRQAEQLIRKLYDADYLVNPQVNITVVEYAQRWVEFFGQVGSPGLVYFPKEEGLTLTTAISRAGSFTRLANRKAVTVKRTYDDGRKPETFTINVDDLTKGGSADTWQLQHGDVISVPERVL